MSDTPETQEAVERWRQGKINIFDEMARMELQRDEARRGIRLMAQNAEVWKERADQARRELDIQLESIKFHMERKDEFISDNKDSSKTLAECIEEKARIVKAVYFDSSEELRKDRTERDFCMSEIERLRKERNVALEKLADWENAAKHVEADHPDEVHCGCVPVLRKLLNETRAALRDIADTSQSTLERGREAHSPAQAKSHLGVPERPDAPTPETDAAVICKHHKSFNGVGGVVGSEFARKLERERNMLDETASQLAADAVRAERERAALATKCKQLSSQLENWQNFGKYSVEVIRMCVVAAYPEYRETMRRFAVLEAAK